MSMTVETTAATLQIDDSGPPQSDRALLFLHYWGGSSATWRKVVALLGSQTRCVAVNQRGWGGSLATDDRYDLGAMADDVVAIIEHLGLTHVILVGHSMGGKVAQIVAARKPPQLAGLVLVAPAPPVPMPVPEQARQQMLESYQSAEGVGHALEVLAGPSLPSEDRSAVIRDTLAGTPDAKREWTERGMTADLVIAAGDLTVPIAVLVGSLDQVEERKRLRAIFEVVAPDAHFDEIAGIGHLAPLEAPKAIADACRAMLAAVGGRIQT